jgi:predicted RNase H-like HicB family nuclease
MNFAVLVEPNNGQYAASLAGVPGICAVGPTRSQAVDALKAELQQRLAAGELLSVEVPTRGVTDLAGVFSDDPSLREICEEAYRARDVELTE